MLNTKSELAQGSPESLATREKIWQNLDKFIPPDNREYQEIIIKGRDSAFERWRMALNMEQGWPMIQKSMEELNRLYERAMQIRSDTAFGNVQTAMRGKLNIPPNQPVLPYLEAQIDKLRDYPDLRSIADDLMKSVRELCENPKDSLGQKSAFNNTCYRQRGNSYIPDFGKVDHARDLVKKIRENPMITMYPDLGPIVNAIEGGIEQVEGIDPAATRGHRWLQEIEAGRKLDFYGLRVVGGIAGAAVTSFGLAYCIIFKKEFSWPLPMWAGITAICANPDLLKGRVDQSLMRTASLMNKQTFELIKYFSGEEGARAYGDLQNLAKTRLSDLKILQTISNPSVAQIGEVVDNPKSPLMGILSGLSPDKRRMALQTFGQRRSSEDQEILRELMIRGTS